MRRFLVILALLGMSAAHAAGVNDTLPNGQNNMPVYQAPRPATGSQTKATPNVSGYMYERRFYRQMYQPQPVQRLPRSR